MSIDWITVAAQIANFLVLIWLLKRFLYRPILDGIDAREAEITARMQAAVLAKANAAAAEAEYHGKAQALEAAQSKVAETVRSEAETQRDALLAEARTRIEQEHAALQAHLDDEATKFTARMYAAGAAALLSLTRKALTDLADEALEARMARHLAGQIKPMTADLGRAAGQAATAVVTSHDVLPAAAQMIVSGEFEKAFPNVPVTFKTDSAQAPGLVLRMGGGQVAWTVDSYIDGLGALISDQLATSQNLKAQRHES
jgi:F-type H+-transporting ATPase subunit b